MRKIDRLIEPAIVVLALALRVAYLGIKPAHFDEGVNGWFVDEMARTGFYHYDPENFHGPLHFYVLFIAQTLLGRHEWALRLPIALVSTGCVAMVLAFRAYFGTAVCRVAAICMAVSPAFVFYGRYAIHESWFVLFLLVTVWGLLGLCHSGSRRCLWAAAAGLTGLVLTKETYIIHGVALASGYGVLRWWEGHSPSAPFTPARQQWTNRDLLWTGAVCVAVLLLFYTGFLLDWSSLPGMVTTFSAWTRTGVAGNGHEKEPWYWLTLMLTYEWPALIGFAATFGLVWPGGQRALRWVAFSGMAGFVGYSLVAYKTPWCLIAIIWPFYFVFGSVAVWVAKRFDRWVIAVAAALVIGVSALASLRLNFRNYANETEPYVYVQTTTDIDRLIGPLRTLAARDPENYQLPGYIVMGEVHPLPWLLGGFPHVHFGNLTDLPADISDGQFLLVADEYTDEVERILSGSWFREKITLRGTSGQTQMLYFRPSTFGSFFPDRQPEFSGPTAPAAKEEQ